MKLRIVMVALVLAMMPVMAMGANGDGHSTGATLLCTTCHAVHDANTAAAAPLWGLADMNTNQTFTMYDVNQHDASATTSRTPTNGSRLCMSCHDGSFAATSATTVSGLDLGNMPPVSFTYDDSKAGYVDSVADATGTTPGLDNSNVECTSCHGMHLATTNILRTTGNGLCRTCHEK